MVTPDEAQIALLAYLKSKASLVDLIGTDRQIKETQWQGTEFTYPAVRVGNDIIPTVEGCTPDSLEGAILVFDEQKSSKRCSTIAAEIANLLHRTNFTSPVNQVQFIRLLVTRITYPVQQEGTNIWQSQVQIRALVNN